MLRNLLLLLGLVGLAAAAGWVAEHPGRLTLDWFGWRVETSAAFLALAVAAFTALFWIFLRLTYALLFMPRSLARRRSGLQQERGLQALTDAFVALGEQDHAAAQKYIAEAERRLSNPALPRLLGLQLARQQGDDAALRRQFDALQESPQTLPLALRGLMEESRRDDRMDEALAHADKLLKLRPRHKPTLLLALDLYSFHRRWQEALLLISRAQKRLMLSGAEARHLTAVISLEQAHAMLTEQNRGSAREMAKAAFKKDPALTAAAALLAGLYAEENKPSHAFATLRKAWAAEPHPALAAQAEKLFASLPPEKRLSKMQELVKSHPQRWESLMAVARAALAAQDYALARQSLKAALGQRETVSLCKLMADLEQQEKKDSAQARVWLDKAATAFPDTGWHCSACGHTPTEWHAHCPECRHFDSIRWQPPRYVVYPAA